MQQSVSENAMPLPKLMFRQDGNGDPIRSETRQADCSVHNE